MTLSHVLRPTILIALLALVTTACSKDPAAESRKYAASGDAYMERKQYDEAVIEYGNAVKATPNAADVRFKLGRAFQDRPCLAAETCFDPPRLRCCSLPPAPRPPSPAPTSTRPRRW